ncbi:PepSY domain-containing protein [Methylobacterium dankookense]|uniref:PepSY domain-containing protein n=1 Tax=Methylobacterium dankookense TaxID=560405 RepID=A0A564G0L3_9HYPH|nr:PepSY domain-containing protein [Methylobacterium dankookense]GJD56166.1 hypothetical protein IFDJLNFL_2061 [Methylobacterium dankookense]VUF13955.1 hypothetical protein MTDSW087_03665 [Methylobacterium dankookense]
MIPSLALPTPKRLKRWLLLGHRWLGILTCLFFATWFVSGVVMMYVAFPRLTEAERRAALPAIAWESVAVRPEAALARAGLAPGAARRLDLAMLGDEPVWRILPWTGARRIVSARDGRMIAGADADLARAVASHHPAARDPAVLDEIARDLWTVHQRYDGARPFHRVALGDAAGTELYVSAVSGEIVLDTSRHERFWNWLGAVPHWLYLTPLRARTELWRGVVLWLSGICVLSAATGLAIGLMRLRGLGTPYRGWMAWHHVAGLTGGVALLVFIASGWFSMNPGRWVSPPAPDPAALRHYAGPDAPLPFDRAALAAACPALDVRLHRVAGRPVTVIACRDGGTVVLGPPAPLEASIREAAPALMAEVGAPRLERLTRSDLYWYGPDRRLPVLRAAFADPAGTWFHIDPETGEVLDRMDSSNRASRWLFNALHSLDLAVLTENRPAWDLVLLVLCAAGLAVSLSGIVIGWRRLRRPVRSRSSRGSGSPALP